MNGLWLHGGTITPGTGEVGSTFYDVLPAHSPALVLGGLGVLIAIGLTRWGAWRSLELATRFLLGLILFDGGAHVGLAFTADEPRWRIAFTGSALLAVLLAYRLASGQSWRLLATTMWVCSLLGYWASSLGGHPIDQVGQVVKLVEIAGLFLTMQSGRRRLLPGVVLTTAMTLNAVMMWGAAFRAGSDDLGVSGHNVGTSPTPGMVMIAAESSEPSVEQAAFADHFYAATVTALLAYGEPDAAGAAGYDMDGLGGIDFHAANPAYQKDGRELDPARPENLIYAMGASGPILMGAMFETEGWHHPPPEEGGPLLHWHRHEQICFSLLPPGLAGLVDPMGMCPVGSIAVPTTNSMMHVWTVPGAPQRFGDLDEAWKQSYLAALVE